MVNLEYELEPENPMPGIIKSHGLHTRGPGCRERVAQPESSFRLGFGCQRHLLLSPPQPHPFASQSIEIGTAANEMPAKASPKNPIKA